MPLTVIALAMNMMLDGTIWITELSKVMKVIIAVMLVAKFFTYFYSSFMADLNLIRNVGLIVCGQLNLGGSICTTIQGIWTAIIPFAILLVLLIILCVLPAIDISRKGGKKE